MTGRSSTRSWTAPSGTDTAAEDAAEEQCRHQRQEEEGMTPNEIVGRIDQRERHVLDGPDRADAALAVEAEVGDGADAEQQHAVAASPPQHEPRRQGQADRQHGDVDDAHPVSRAARGAWAWGSGRRRRSPAAFAGTAPNSVVEATATSRRVSSQGHHVPGRARRSTRHHSPLGARGAHPGVGDPHDGDVRARDLNRAAVAFDTAVVADLQAQRSVACRRPAGFHALAAPVAQGLVDDVLVVVVVRILLIDPPDDPPLQRVLRADLARRDAALVRHAGDVVVGRAEHAVAALVEVVHRLDRRQAQDAGGSAQVAGGALADRPGRPCRPRRGAPAGRPPTRGRQADDAAGAIDELATRAGLAHGCQRSR